MQGIKVLALSIVDLCIGAGVIKNEDREKQMETLIEDATEASIYSGDSLETVLNKVKACVQERINRETAEQVFEKIKDVEICEALIEPREPLPPYRERLHPRGKYSKRPFWFRTRSNPVRRGYH